MFRAVEAIFRFPFSILHLNDGDGLENSVDPDPLTPGNDAHGTNSEWYNVVCSNVYAAVESESGIELLPCTGDVNTNAYYFVDVVAERGPAPIRFVADGASRLGNPVLIAQADETNRVPLLIGAAYSVSSDVPFYGDATTFEPQACCDVNAARRSSFSLHFFTMSGAWVFDGCVGPVLGNVGLDDYIQMSVDSGRSPIGSRPGTAADVFDFIDIRFFE